MRARPIAALLVSASACAADTSPDGPAADSTDSDTSAGGETSETSAGAVEIELDALQSWTRVEEPVLRDPESRLVYEVASDIHVFRDDDGDLRAVYTGPNPQVDVSSIKLASASDHTAWDPGEVVLDSAGSTMPQLNKETAIYRRAESGRHQIFYIGYADPGTYEAQIFLAESDEVVGPYTPFDEPVIARGAQAGHDVYLMTSPSIVAHAGALYMVYCAWDAFVDVTAVWVHGATSEDDGRTWTVVGEVDVPVCMEGSFVRGPDGKFYAVATAENGFTLGRADEPFGPYAMLPDPILTPAGLPWENEIIAPQLLFDSDRAYLYYTGVDEAAGWWTMLAFTDLD